MDLEHKELTEKIIGAAIRVHKQLGPGFIESIYESALVLEMRKRGLKVERQLDLPIYYDGVEIGRHRLDLFVDDTIVVELKAVRELEKVHFAVVRSYLHAIGRDHGLILNFAKSTLQAKRVKSKTEEDIEIPWLHE